MHPVPAFLPPTLAAIFAGVALVHLAGPRVLREVFAEWGFARGFHRVVGTFALITAAFLALPETRLWGVAVGSFMLFVATIILLDRGKYLYAAPNIVLLAALLPAALAGPF